MRLWGRGEGVRHQEVIIDGNLVIGGQYHPFIGTDGSGSSKNQSLDFLACSILASLECISVLKRNWSGRKDGDEEVA